MLGYEGRRYGAGQGNKPSRHEPLHYYLKRQLKKHKRNGTLLPFKQAFSRENLYDCFEELKRSGGQAAGVDGITYSDLSPGEVSRFVGQLSKCIRGGKYRPHDTRSVPIPKGPGKGYRTLKIKIIFDRVVAKTLQKALSPLTSYIWSRMCMKAKRYSIELASA